MQTFTPILHTVNRSARIVSEAARVQRSMDRRFAAGPAPTFLVTLPRNWTLDACFPNLAVALLAPRTLLRLHTPYIANTQPLRGHYRTYEEQWKTKGS